MAILYVGIDPAKSVFAIQGVDEHGKAVLVWPSVPRARVHQLVAALPPVMIGMEACSGAHHWARLFMKEVPDFLERGVKQLLEVRLFRYVADPGRGALPG